MWEVFFHNPHDRMSREALESLQAAGASIDEIADISDAATKARFPEYRLRTAPAYVVFDDAGAVLYSAEEGGIDPAVIAGMSFEPVPAPLTLERRIAEAEEALAILHLEVSRLATPGGA